MSTNAVLDAAIGLIFMYLVLSLFCTTINEFIANLLSLRAKTLRDALKELIDDDKLRTLFYNHGLIDGAKVAATAGSTPPVRTANAETSGASFATSKHPSYLSGRDVAMALIDSVSFMNDANLNAIYDAGSTAQSVIQKLPDSNIRDALMSCIAQADGDITKLRDEVANWFDSSMDRLSGAYKRYLQIISIVVGLALAGIFNADTIHVAGVLWNDAALSASVSQSASKFVSTQPTAEKCDQKDNDAILKCQTDQMKKLNDTLRPLPIGWTAWPHGIFEWFCKILGIIATAIALTLGAPFWFDMLSKFVNLRGTGTKPEKSKAT